MEKNEKKDENKQEGSKIKTRLRQGQLYEQKHAIVCNGTRIRDWDKQA